MEKRELRKLFRKKRKELTSERTEALSQAIADRFLKFVDGLRTPIHYVHLFLPIEKNHEVNTWPILKALQDRNDIEVVVPRTDLSKERMEHFLMEKDTLLVKNEMGIPEPRDGTRIAEEKIDLVVMPLLAYDKSGDRVGYGGGFYDRFLEACRADVIKVGLSFFPPVEKIQDVDEHDVVLDHCVTPGSVHSFEGRSLGPA